MDSLPTSDIESTHAPAGSASPAGQADGMTTRRWSVQDKLVAGKLAGLRRAYANDCDVVIAGVWNDAAGAELRCAFTLRRDHKLRMRVFQIPAAGVANDVSRARHIVEAFATFRAAIVEAVALPPW
jgi:hypothetical protein